MKVVGVSFRHQCKMYWFGAKDEDILRGQHVIVETEQGMSYADVVVPTTEIADEDLPEVVKPILRVATDDDDDQQRLNEKNEAEAVVICKQKVKEHEKEMKIIRAMYSFDRTKLTFYFTADGRVDFVALVKDLAHEFRTRIELRQVGVRDETRLLGGIGVCGRELCCATWLTDFVQVPIKAAKEQNLSLNTAKISGFCGRLMCCLKNEEDTYRFLNSKLPDINQMVRTKTGEKGIVKATNILKQRVSVLFGEGDEEKELREYGVEDLIFEPSKKKQYIPATKDETEETETRVEPKQENDGGTTPAKGPRRRENEGGENQAEGTPKKDSEPIENFREDTRKKDAAPAENSGERNQKKNDSNGEKKQHTKQHANRYGKAIAKNNAEKEERKPDLEELIAMEEEKKNSPAGGFSKNENQNGGEEGQKEFHKKKYWNKNRNNYWRNKNKNNGGNSDKGGSGN